MSGEELYGNYRSELGARNVEADRWHELSPVERDAWDALAAQVTWVL